MARRYYSSIAQATTLNGSINSTTTTVVVTATTGFPSSFPYTLIIDPDTVNEELVTVTSAASTTLTVTRGVDGTTGVAHSSGAVVRHGVSARDFDEPNSHVNDTTTDVHPQYLMETLLDAKGDLLVASAADTAARLAVGADTYVLTADTAATNGVKWAAPAAGATGGSTDKIFWENDQTVTTSYTLTTNKNAGSFGPITINSGATVTVPSGATWSVV